MGLLSSTCCILFTFCFFSKQLVCWKRGTYNQCYGHKQKLSWRFIGDNPDSKNKVVFLEWKKRVFIHAMRYFWWERVPLCVFRMQRMMERNLCCGTQTKQGGGGGESLSVCAWHFFSSKNGGGGGRIRFILNIAVVNMAFGIQIRRGGDEILSLRYLC